MTEPRDCTGLRVTRVHFPALCHLTQLGFQFDLSQARQDPSFKYDNGYILQRGDRAVASGWINNVSCQGDGVDLAVAAILQRSHGGDCHGPDGSPHYLCAAGESGQGPGRQAGDGLYLSSLVYTGQG
ncbi:MAG: hypothetical protein ACKO4L_10745 [Nodosilinea sp.]